MTTSPALAAAIAADAEATGANAAAPGALPPAADPAGPPLDKAKLTRELAANIYGAIALVGARYPTVRQQVTAEDAEETAHSIVAAFDAWGVLHWLQGGKYMLAAQALMTSYALGAKIADAIRADVQARAAAAPPGDADPSPRKE